MKNHTILFLALPLLFFMACEKKATPNPSVYENCCGAEATADQENFVMAWPNGSGGTFDSTVVGQVYIPNIFIPGADASESGLFMIFGNQAVLKVVSAKYFCSCGALAFSRENFQPNDSGFAWDGKQSNGTYYQGGFDYVVKVLFINGLEKTYSGKACAFTCGDPGFPEERLPDCLFPNQNNGNGAPDNSLPMPSNCF